eukprot:COSAG06_NODE_19293_length_844_cov_17.038926_1_plen_115_part_00
MGPLQAAEGGQLEMWRIEVPTKASLSWQRLSLRCDLQHKNSNLCQDRLRTSTGRFHKEGGLFDVVGFQLADREVKAERKTVNAWAKKNKKELEGGEKKIQADYAEMLATVNAKV